MFRLNIRKNILYCNGGEALAQVVQSGCGLPIPGSVKCHMGWGFE